MKQLIVLLAAVILVLALADGTGNLVPIAPNAAHTDQGGTGGSR